MPEIAEVSVATAADLETVRVLDRHLTQEALLRKLQRGEVLIACVQGGVVGCLRFGWFWDEIPFLNLLWVQESYRQLGVGRMLVTDWEERMRAEHHSLVLTSTLANEDGQHFWRALGYEDCGALLLPGEVAELFLRKTL